MNHVFNFLGWVARRQARRRADCQIFSLNFPLQLSPPPLRPQGNGDLQVGNPQPSGTDLLVHPRKQFVQVFFV